VEFTQLLYSVPVVLFALGAVMLWRRRRSFATLLMAFGFVAMLLGEVASLVMSHNVEAAVRANPSLILAHQSHIVPLIAHYLLLSGVWAAAVGLVWHASANR